MSYYIWHSIILLGTTIFFFCKSDDAIKNIFFFMSTSLQVFVFLILISQQYFFSFLILIVYIGAIAVLFLFVVLSIGKPKISFSSYESWGYSSINKKLPPTQLFFRGICLSFFTTFFSFLILKFVFIFSKELSVLFWDNSVFNYHYEYLLLLRYATISELFNHFSLPINLDTFSLQMCFNTYSSDLISNLTRPELFGFWLPESNGFYPSGWGSCLFFRDSAILYLSGFILLATTIGLISIIIERKGYINSND